MVRLRLDLAYDGGAFYGWARQPTLRTVQGELEQALHTILRVSADDQDEPLRLTVAGRTDTGVHALHQVCHLDVGEATLERCVGHMGVPAPEALFRRLSRMVPDDIAIHAVSVAPEGFDARFSALERTYVYRICDDARPVDPRMRGFVLALDDRLDLDAMNAAAAMTISTVSILETGGRASWLLRGRMALSQPSSSSVPGSNSTRSPTMGFKRARRNLACARS